MRNNFQILLIVLSLFPYLAISEVILPQNNLHSIRNPFKQSQFLSCQQQEKQLFENIALWQYQGKVFSSSKAETKTAIFWLSDNKTWVQINMKYKSETIKSFYPWQLTQADENELIWDATLPDYCQKIIRYTMEFKTRK